MHSPGGYAMRMITVAITLALFVGSQTVAAQEKTS
jgi:hypothetical protein